MACLVVLFVSPKHKVSGWFQHTSAIEAMGAHADIGETKIYVGESIYAIPVSRRKVHVTLADDHLRAQSLRKHHG